ncbi:hypothetical protein CAPTEDRAFT_218051 [Capitella teleta]|uniref:Uncharacterized protein n=1 Tax=Capitella teleta TaxID=283909 RepID=R7TZ76_CAPTE|nr:hypothetical protein CAPTEDRAFT_218051 [Capitella teleta]|eukprot:ELT98922.1 hypothetical protein CAPTEDRAFT_218051 [Capitella teleta]
MHQSTAENLRNVVLDHLTPEMIHAVKITLFANVDDGIVDPNVERRGSVSSRPTSKRREKKEVDGNIVALDALDKAEKPPIIHIPATNVFETLKKLEIKLRGSAFNYRAMRRIRNEVPASQLSTSASIEVQEAEQWLRVVIDEDEMEIILHEVHSTKEGIIAFE